MQDLRTPSVSELTSSSGHHAPLFPLPHARGPSPASELEREPSLPTRSARLPPYEAHICHRPLGANW
eukprot:8005603-Alexandrium_andersonii.AAC.1